jgi:ATP-dependent RNA helicase DDX5/DBP2
MSTVDDKAAKKAKKAAMKKEAEDLGITYDELKAQRKKDAKNREATSLQNDDQTRDMKRMRAWSKDLTGEENAKRRTRSMDAAEEKKIEAEVSPEGWRAEHSISIQGHGANKGCDVPLPFMQFDQAPFSGAIQKAIKAIGFATPTHIQSQAWPIAIQGKDMICIAKTGSGKTCGFLLPSFHQHLESRGSVGGKQSNDPMMLILVVSWLFRSWKRPSVSVALLASAPSVAMEAPLNTLRSLLFREELNALSQLLVD